MKAELFLCGKRFDMAPRTNRRRLVVLIYLAFAALIAVTWPIKFGGIFSFLIVFIANSVNSFIFGGYSFSVQGMIKPFLGNEVRARYTENPNSKWSRTCRMNIPEVSNNRNFRSDEREVRRRDNVHWMAYRYLGILVAILFFLTYLKNGWTQIVPFWVGPAREILDRLVFGLLIAGFVLFLTLPQAILLWTEPDMEEEG